MYKRQEKELVFFLEYIDRFEIRTPRIFLHPFDIYDKVKSGISAEELFGTQLVTYDDSRWDLLDRLIEIPVQGTRIINEGTDQEVEFVHHLTFNRRVNMYLFQFDTSTYINLFSTLNSLSQDIEKSTISVIRKYQPDNTFKDICYFLRVSELR